MTKLEDQLKAADPSTPSLTQFADAGEKLIAHLHEKLDHKAVMPGLVGLEARVRLKMYEAYMRARCAELDNNILERKINAAIAGVVGDILASMVLSTYKGLPIPERLEGGYLFANAVRERMIAVINNSETLKASEVDGVTVAPQTTGHG